MPEKIKPEYLPLTEIQKLGYFVEESGEVLCAVGKTIRWGVESVNPELPAHEQETNRDWMLREIVDLKRAIKTLEKHLEDNY